MKEEREKKEGGMTLREIRIKKGMEMDNPKLVKGDWMILEEQMKRLRRLRIEKGIPQAKAVRQAIAIYLDWKDGKVEIKRKDEPEKQG